MMMMMVMMISSFLSPHPPSTIHHPPSPAPHSPSVSLSQSHSSSFRNLHSPLTSPKLTTSLQPVFNQSKYPFCRQRHSCHHHQQLAWHV